MSVSSRRITAVGGALCLLRTVDPAQLILLRACPTDSALAPASEWQPVPRTSSLACDAELPQDGFGPLLHQWL
jgi:hypothetical protein